MTRLGDGPAPRSGAFQVLVMAKYPALGAVKTRLARRVGMVAASDLYRAFLLDLEERLRQDGLAVTWAFWPP